MGKDSIFSASVLILFLLLAGCKTPKGQVHPYLSTWEPTHGQSPSATVNTLGPPSERRKVMLDQGKEIEVLSYIYPYRSGIIYKFRSKSFLFLNGEYIPTYQESDPGYPRDLNSSVQKRQVEYSNETEHTLPENVDVKEQDGETSVRTNSIKTSEDTVLEQSGASKDTSNPSVRKTMEEDSSKARDDVKESQKQTAKPSKSSLQSVFVAGLTRSGDIVSARFVSDTSLWLRLRPTIYYEYSRDELRQRAGIVARNYERESGDRIVVSILNPDGGGIYVRGY